VGDASSSDPTSPSAADNAAAPRIVTSESLLAGRRELLIQHGTEQYRLRLTASNKLILVK
jgi:hemin uptake protein HemP